MIEQEHLLYHLSVLEGSLSGIDNKKLSNDVLSNKDKLRSTLITDSSYEDTNFPPSTELEIITNEITKDFERATGTYTLSLDIFNKTNPDFWGHIQEKKMSTNHHNHGSGGGVSCVYYCQIPQNSARIVFLWKEDQDARHHEYSIAPQEGSYLLSGKCLSNLLRNPSNNEAKVS